LERRIWIIIRQGKCCIRRVAEEDFMKKILIIIAVLFLVGCAEGTTSYKDFAECIADSGAVMYGSDQCDVCQNQKKMFGTDFQYINYVNCDFHEDECAEEGILKYPIWKIDGEVMGNELGLKTFDELEESTGCHFD
jgi:hypothetical protein